jgi:hypothetical protein
MTVVKLYKFQALVTLPAAGDGAPCGELGPSPRRTVLVGQDGESGRNRFFMVLVSCDEDAPLGRGNRRLLVTLRLADDDVADYLGIGRHFNLWLGGQVGDGVVTRRLFV